MKGFLTDLENCYICTSSCRDVEDFYWTDCPYSLHGWGQFCFKQQKPRGAASIGSLFSGWKRCNGVNLRKYFFSDHQIFCLNFSQSVRIFLKLYFEITESLLPSHSIFSFNHKVLKLQCKATMLTDNPNYSKAAAKGLKENKKSLPSCMSPCEPRSFVNRNIQSFKDSCEVSKW